MDISQFIEKYNPCQEARDWLDTQKSLARAWTKCERADWMLWALWKIGEPKSIRVSLAADFAEHVLPIFEKRYPDDKRPRTAIEKARAWAKLQTDEARQEARTATDAAAYAAYAAAYAAADAAYAAYAAAYAADAAAYAAYAAYAAADAAAYAAAARKQECQWQCNHIRKIVKNPFDK